MSSFLFTQERRHSLFLFGKLLKSMSTVFSVAVIISVLSLAVFQAVKNLRSAGQVDVKAGLMPRLLCVVAIMFSCGMLCGSDLKFRILADMILAVASMSFLILSMRPPEEKIRHAGFVPAVMLLISLYYILCAVDVVEMFPDRFFFVFADFVAIIYPLVFIRMIWRRLRDVKAVMRSGNSWSFVCLCVDIVYVLFPILILVLLHVLYVMFPGLSSGPVIAAVVLLLLEIIAIGVRVSYDSVFVIWHDHERLIVESMKISYMEVNMNPDSRAEEQYRELYERILLYFEMSRPYLDSELTINDIVKVVYSNKVYISKAICHYTGRNFRQFVNYHRIMYSMDTFRDRPELKVSELAEMSGFNSVVSYTMAFRLFMNETPSEWCRKERAKILKPKK